MVPDILFEDFGHETGSAASHGCQSHQNIGIVVPVSGQNAFDYLNLPTNPLNACDELLFFFYSWEASRENTIGGYPTCENLGNYDGTLARNRLGGMPYCEGKNPIFSPPVADTLWHARIPQNT